MRGGARGRRGREGERWRGGGRTLKHIGLLDTHLADGNSLGQVVTDLITVEGRFPGRELRLDRIDQIAQHLAEGRRTKDEGRREKGEGRREKGDGRRKEGRRRGRRRGGRKALVHAVVTVEGCRRQAA